MERYCCNDICGALTTSEVNGLRLDELILSKINAKLTHMCLASLKRDIGKQCRPRSDAAEQGLQCLLVGISI